MANMNEGNNKQDKEISNAAEKTHLKDNSSKPKTKVHKFKPHHAKPYRKRHYGSLFALVSMLFIASLLLVGFSVQINNSTNNAKAYLDEIFSAPANTKQNIQSSYGYTVQYDPLSYYAAALTNQDNKLYAANDLTQIRDYKTVVVSSSAVNSTSKKGSVSINYLYGSDQLSKDKLQDMLIQSESTPQSNLVPKNSTEIQINGVSFLKTNWQRNFNSQDSLPKINALITTYVGIVNGSPLTAIINHGFITENKDFTQIVENINFGQPSKQTSTTKLDPTTQLSTQKNIIDKLLFSGVAGAITPAIASEKIGSLYSPAVVRIYNVYCQNAKIDGKLYLPVMCSGGVGSGFFVSSDGYIATNGHVAVSSVKEMLIGVATEKYIAGDDSQLSNLFALAGGKISDVASAKTEQDAYGQIFNTIYNMPDSRFSTDQSISNLLVTLGEQQPDVNELASLTQSGKEYKEQDTIKRAKFVAADYRAYDGINGFKASDVALIKIDGSNYPIVKLGSIDEATQGSNLNIIGFPSGANNNGLVAASKSRSTLTTGKVTAIKEVNGSNNKIIETDANIGHGNSGGPAFIDNGDVVGIATYTIDGSGEGNGVFNYVRSISDLNNLANISNISYNLNSTTQNEWSKGIDNFYKAHYSKAIKNFETTKLNYTAHPTAPTLIAASKAKISAGEEVKEFPIIILLIILITLLTISATAVTIIIIRHKRKHQLYKQQFGTQDNFSSNSGPTGSAQTNQINQIALPNNQDSLQLDDAPTVNPAQTLQTPTFEPKANSLDITSQTNNLAVNTKTVDDSQTEQIIKPAQPSVQEVTKPTTNPIAQAQAPILQKINQPPNQITPNQKST